MPEPAANPQKARRKKLTGWRKWVLRLSLLTVVPTLFFVLLEGGLRIAGYGYPTAFLVRMEGRDVLIANEKFGWRFFPRAISRTPALLQLPPEKPPGTYRVFVLGSSAAMGMPDASFSVGRFLEAMLRDRFPATRFEVVNAAMTAINSHVVLPIARDCARHEPDLFVVYMGNNEVVGPFGTGTVFRAFSSSLPVIRATIWAKSMKIGQLLEDLFQPLRRKEDDLKRWRGMEMFLANQVAADDPRMPALYRHFRTNLADICRVGTRSGAKVVVCTVATNLRDNAPFASLHRADLSEADRARWEGAYAAGIELGAAGQHAKAVGRYQEAAKIDDRFADLHFRLAHGLLALKRADEASRHFVLARDLDALRFRADSAINDAIRRMASGREAEGVYLAEAERAFEAAAPDGIPGDGLFYEHVHLRPAGNYLLAAVAFRQIAPGLPPSVRGTAPGDAEPPSSERCAELLALTDWDVHRMALAMSDVTSQPPFTHQFDHRERQALTRARLKALAKGTAPEALAAAHKVYLGAIGKAPEDWQVRWNFALLQDKRGDYASAEKEWRFVLDLFPDSSMAHEDLSLVLLKGGKSAEALAHLAEAMRIRPKYGVPHANFAKVLFEQGKTDEAIEQFAHALRIQPDYASAHNSLAAALLKQGKVEDAIEHFRDAIRLQPDYSSPHRNLAAILSRQGKSDEAIAHYNDVLRIEPDDAAAHAALAGVLDRLAKTDEAVAHYREALRLQPDLVAAHRGLGRALAEQGKLEEAAAHLTEALRRDPNQASAHRHLAAILAKQGDLDAAIAHYREAARLQPDIWETHYRLARALVIQRKFGEAVPHYRQALGLRPAWAAGLAELAAAEAEAGQFPQAARTAQQALGLARAEQDSALAARLQQDLEAYQAGRRPSARPGVLEP